MADPRLTISTSPFLKDSTTTPRIMWEVVYTLIPLVLVAFYYFGLSAILVTSTAVLACLLTEYTFSANRKSYSIKDGSGLITGLLLALTLPPGFPLWMVFVGGVVAIGMGKVIWGGLGQNIFNPALLGRAFLQAAFPIATTTWTPPDGRYVDIRGSNMAFPLFQGENLDGISTATPLAKMKFEQYDTPVTDLLIGNTGGSLGETCALLLLVLMGYLIVRKIIKWQIPFSIVLTVTLFSSIFHRIDPEQFASAQFMILSGGLLLGAVYMATDLVTSPVTSKGLWIYGIGIGILVVLIRYWGGLPEGVMYAILLMNAATPLINRFSRLRTFGHRK